jgi:hypothetical protein
LEGGVIDIVGQIGPDFIEAWEARKGVDVFHDGAAARMESSDEWDGRLRRVISSLFVVSRIDHPGESIYTRVMGLLDGKFELVTNPTSQTNTRHAAATKDVEEEDLFY